MPGIYHHPNSLVNVGLTPSFSDLSVHASERCLQRVAHPVRERQRERQLLHGDARAAAIVAPAQRQRVRNCCIDVVSTRFG